nr:hypothetical protein [Tanacetum cinerariifolium]
MSANDKFGLGYGDYIYGSNLSYENEVLQSVFMNKESDLEDTPVNDRYVARMHAVSLPMTGNYMSFGPGVEIDYSKFTYGLKQTSVAESDSKPSEYASCESDSSVETTTSMPEPVENAPKVVCEPKVWTDAPIIEEYESDSDDDSVSKVQEDKEKLSFAFTDSVKHVKTSRENVKEIGTPNHSLKVEKQSRNGHTKKGLGYARKTCIVCGSFSHLIRDCDFHEKRMAKQAELTKSKNKTKFSSPVASTSTASKVNTARPFVNETKPKGYFYKTHSPNKRPFHNKTAQITPFSYHKVNTVNTSLSVVKGNEDAAVKASAELASLEANGFCKELASPKQMTFGKHISNPFMAGGLPKTKWVLALEQSKTAQDLMIKKLQKKVKKIKKKINARTPRMTLFKIGNFRRKSLDKENVSKQGRYLKTMPMFEESNFDNIDDIVDEDND